MLLFTLIDGTGNPLMETWVISISEIPHHYVKRNTFNKRRMRTRKSIRWIYGKNNKQLSYAISVFLCNIDCLK